MRGVGLWVALGWIGMAFSPSAASAQVCTPQTFTFTESFDNTTYKDAGSSVDGWGQGAIKLSSKATGLAGDSNSVGVKVYIAAAADFDGDGWQDMMALVLDPTCHLHFLKNLGTDASGNHLGFSAGGAVGSAGFTDYSILTPPSCGTDGPMLLTGDWDGDGDKGDLVYMRNANENNAGTMFLAQLYKFNGTAAGKPVFGAPVDIFSQLNTGPSAPSWHWTATSAQTVDWPPTDGVNDLVILDSFNTTNRVKLYRGVAGGGFSAPVTLISNIGMATTIAYVTSGATGTSACPPAVSRGANTLVVIDADKDGDYDIVVGSVSEKNLKYWKNTGGDVFAAQSDLGFPEGGACIGLAGDFDGDGDNDMVIGRDGKNCNGLGGTAWFFVNDGTGNFAKRLTPATSAGDDLDFGVAFDIDHDTGNKLDTIVADGNDSGVYYQVISQNLPIYNLSGTAISKRLDSLNGATDAIVGVTISGLTATGVTATEGFDLYVSNDGGTDWETVVTEEKPASLGGSSQPHYFTTYGTDFRWKAVFFALQDTLAADETIYAPASTSSPIIKDISFSYQVVDRRQYSRSTVAYGTAGGREMVYQASYWFPGFEASLTAFDITDLAPATSTCSLSCSDSCVDRLADNDGVTIPFDAGAVLDGTVPAGRNIKVIYDQDSDGKYDELLSFSGSATLYTLMATDAITGAKVINWVRGAYGTGSPHRPWKFFDTGHSSPVFIGEPYGDVDYLGDNYGTFKTTNAGRLPMVYLGANDGMFHGFNADTGTERFAIVPHNLVAKLKNQRTLLGTIEEYQHDYYVDGRITTADVFDGSNWRTVAVVGQAKGQGLLENNYYFALDVTDPTSPQALWELTDPRDHNWASCSGDGNVTTCTPVYGPQTCTNTCPATAPEYADTGGQVVIEAEHYSTTPTSVTESWVSTTALTGYSGSSYMTTSNDDGGDCVIVGSSVLTVAAPQVSCGGKLSYSVEVATSANYHVYLRIRSPDNNGNRIIVGLDGTPKNTIVTTANTVWLWIEADMDAGTAGVQGLSNFSGEHTLQFWVDEDGLRFDKVILSTSATLPTDPTGTNATEYCSQTCTPDPAPIINPGCTTVTYNETQEWPHQCGGIGSGLTCCQNGGSPQCAPVGQCSLLSQPDPIMGETWSPPAIGKVRISGSDRWLAFFGSGKNNRGSLTPVGRTIYAVDVFTGVMVGRWELDDVASGAGNLSTLENALPAGGRLVDIDDDPSDGGYGYADRFYIGDLEGRMWRLDLSSNASLTGGLISNWDLTAIFDAADIGGVRGWAPIVTKPAIRVARANTASGPNLVYLYFGTGGNDDAPDDVLYRFYAIVDDGGVITRKPSDISTAPSCGAPPATDVLQSNEFYVEGPAGFKYWSDPMLRSGSAVYFASLYGDIESVNPCFDIGSGTTSKIYGYAVRSFRSADGTNYQPGQPLFKTIDISNTKIREAFIARSQYDSGQARFETPTTQAKKDVYIPTTGGASNGGAPSPLYLPDVGLTATNPGRLRILNWREVPL